MPFVLLAILSCDAPKSPTTETRRAQPTSRFIIEQDTATAVAHTALMSIRGEIQALRRGERPLAADYREAFIGIIDADTVSKRLHKHMGDVGNRSPEKTAADFAANWAAMLMYYVDGLDLDHLETLITREGTQRTNVAARAVGVRGEAKILVECRLGEDAKWRVVGVAFLSEPPGVAASPLTTTQRSTSQP